MHDDERPLSVLMQEVLNRQIPNMPSADVAYARQKITEQMAREKADKEASLPPRRQRRQSPPENVDEIACQAAWDELSRKAAWATPESQVHVLNAITALWHVRHYEQRHPNAKTHADFLREAQEALANVEVRTNLTRDEKRCSLPARFEAYANRTIERDRCGSKLAELRQRLVAYWQKKWDKPFNPDRPRI